MKIVGGNKKPRPSVAGRGLNLLCLYLLLQQNHLLSFNKVTGLEFIEIYSTW